MHGGVFTATEGAGMGAAGAFFFALARGTLSWTSLYEILLESARTTAMLFSLLIAATIFANFVNFTTMPGDLKEWITHSGLSPITVVGAVMVIQIGLISPPVGMNLFVLNTLLPKVGLGTIFRGVWPLVLVLVFTLGILLAFPALSLWLPSLMD
jgi:TRAP-type C4-dicarboxylate transport system permease large subunit